MTLPLGIHRGLASTAYHEIDAIGSSRLEWLAISPKHYRHRLTQPDAPTATMELGTMLHCALLEPERWMRDYVLEPDLAALYPLAVKPRALKDYQAWKAEHEKAGRTILRPDQAAAIVGMTRSVFDHPLTSKALACCRDREVSFLWRVGDRLCKGRADALGPGTLLDVKTTRSLRRFSPWSVTEFGLHRQAGHYVTGLAACGVEIERVLLLAIENTPPFDTALFALDPDALRAGQLHNEQLLDLLARCEATDSWPGGWPTVQTATIADRLMDEEIAA